MVSKRTVSVQNSGTVHTEMSGVKKKIDLFLVFLLLGQRLTEAGRVWSSPQQSAEERARDEEGGDNGGKGNDRRGVWVNI